MITRIMVLAGVLALTIAAGAAPKAKLKPVDGWTVRELRPGVCLFRDRAFTLKELPKPLEGVPFLVGLFGEAETVRAEVLEDGEIVVLAPTSDHVSQAKTLTAQGFAIDTSVPRFQSWGHWSCDRPATWRKFVKKGEKISFGKWAVLCDFDASNLPVERVSGKNLALVKKLRRTYTPDEVQDINVTTPDYAVYIPPHPGRRHERVRAGTHDTYNDHFQVIHDPVRKCHYAFWTQATREPMADHHTAFSKSADGGRTWSPVRILAGSMTTNFADRVPGGSWQQPMLAKTGRLYCLWSDGYTHRLHGRYSDDGGETWSVPARADFDPRTPREKKEGAGRAEWWCNWQRPLRLGPDDHFFVGSSRGRDGLEFWEFANIDANPEIKDVQVIVHASGDKALKVPPDENGKAVCEEASIMKLPDGRLFAVMRATGGTAVWSVSADRGRTWIQPEKLRTKDGGDFIRHSVSPCPVYDWKGPEAGSGVYFGMFHLEVTDHRGPLYLVPGVFDPKARQPVAFTGKPKLFEPRGHWNSFYTSYTHTDGVGTLWYPDAAKFYLLGRDIHGEFFK